MRKHRNILEVLLVLIMLAFALYVSKTVLSGKRCIFISKRLRESRLLAPSGLWLTVLVSRSHLERNMHIRVHTVLYHPISTKTCHSIVDIVAGSLSQSRRKDGPHVGGEPELTRFKPERHQTARRFN